MPPVDHLPDRLRDRALGSLLGLAVGDALGMPTQSLSPVAVRRRFGLVDRLHDASPDQPVAPGMPAGSVTDDTEQALLLADELVRGGGHVDPSRYAAALGAWEAAELARGSSDLLGPSTRNALERVRAGEDPATAGRTGATNGAAMRVAPVGIATGTDERALLLDRVEESALVTHHTTLGVAGAAAVAAAVCAGVGGGGVDAALESAVRAARDGARRGSWVAGAAVAERTEQACAWLDAVDDGDDEGVLHVVDARIGTSLAVQESVVAALALAHHYAADPFAGLCAAASAGGDTDTVAAMAGAVLGACHGASAWPADVVATVVAVNRLDLVPVVTGLLALRTAGRAR